MTQFYRKIESRLKISKDASTYMCKEEEGVDI